MLGKLLPRSAPFFEYFQEQNDILRKMANLLVAVVEASPEAEDSLTQMHRLEVQADTLQRTIIQKLAQTFITPIDREDIYALSNAYERAIDSFHALGSRFFLLSFVHARFPMMEVIKNMLGMVEAIDRLLYCLKKHLVPDQSVTKFKELKENSEMLLNAGLSELMDMEMDGFVQVKLMIAWNRVYDRLEQSLIGMSDLSDALEQAALKYV